MIAEKSEGGNTIRVLSWLKRTPWLRLLISLLLSAGGLWFVVRDTSWNEVAFSFQQAQLQYVLLALMVVIVTTVAKTWRWRLLFRPRSQAPSFPDLFWAVCLGQLVNTVVPFLRLGDVARAVNIGEHDKSSKARALGTLVVEKVLDLIMLTLTLFLLLPFLVIPSFVSESGVVLALMGLFAFLTLYVVAFKGELLLRLARWTLNPLPSAWRERALNVLVAGLQGLVALRHPATIVVLLASSALIAFLSVLTPWILFSAMNIPLGLVAGAAIHVVLTAGTVPPSTPAKVGVFEFLVAFMLRFFGID
ncbi:MAG TPA: lysylphosphatidylglycerol synthase transmembrane domain-containing protein, partial [Candidatus Sulfomarinibacteraceae bacterium]|nr:lysylphosphatidylglycerol synthase transmembrane domain-containing protein [Candidatus Sulfomarinibacteraceae bacterium]